MTSATPDFEALARQLLCGSILHAGQRRGRLLEVEFYYWSESHPDPYVHRHSDQREANRWYLHRAGRNGAFRAGSFKGLDLTFGPVSSWGGVLLRAVAWQPTGSTHQQLNTGEVVEGPCLLVESLMQAVGAETVAGLHQLIGQHSSVDSDNPVWLEPRATAVEAGPGDEADWSLELWSSARVGLTLKRRSRFPSMPNWIARRYRFTTAPDLCKGKVQTVVGCFEDGLSNAEISSLTGSRSGYIARLRRAWRDGRARAVSESPLPAGSIRGADLARVLGQTGAATDPVSRAGEKSAETSETR